MPITAPSPSSKPPVMSGAWLETPLSPQVLVASLWTVVGCANLLLLELGPSRAGEAVKVIGTVVCGLVMSIMLSAATTQLVERRGRFTLAILTRLALSGGAGLWAFDAVFQAQDIGSGRLRWPSEGSLVSVRLNLVYYDLIFFLQTSALALLALERTVHARERQLSEARLAAQQARLEALRLQLNPHFLFNTLNAVSILVEDGRTGDAEEMIARLSAFLRTSLDWEGGDLVPLEMELETVGAYLDIERVRFGSRLLIHYACEEGLSDALVPRMILQPLAENALKYAVVPAKTAVTVSIVAGARGDSLVLSVENDGGLQDGAKPKSGAGVGLKNITERLAALYGEEAALQALSTPDGFAAVMRIPLRRAGPEEPE
jgi:sensor histidine kinase YesM